VKVGWEVKRLGELLEIKNGFAFDSKNFKVEKGVPLIRIRDLKEGRGTAVNFDGEYKDEYLCKPGDFLIGMDGEFGCYEWKGEPALLNQRVCRLENFNDRLLSRFLFHGINKYLREIEDVTGYTTVKHLSSKTIKEIEFPLPPLEEQKRIVAILDEAFEGLTRARAHTETNLQNAQDLFEAFLSSFFESAADGWKTEKLENVVSHDCTLSYGIVQPGDEFEGGQLIVRPTDLGPRVISTEGLKRINPVLAVSYGRTTLKGGELLLCVRGTTGTIAIASEELAGANVTRGLVPIRFDPSKVTQELGYYLFRSGAVQKQIEQATYGAALMQINIRDVRKLTVSYPPLEDQKLRISELVEAEGTCDRLVSHYRAKLADLDALRQSLLQKAFAGELT
jgi:type I restriction enzyme, S subunit